MYMKLSIESEYEYFLTHSRQNPDKVAIHQLVAIADGADPYKVFSDDWHVHHKDSVKSMNSRENLELLSASEHIKEHGTTGELDLPVDELVRLYEDEWLNTRQIADRFDCSQPAITSRLKSAGVELRDNSSRWDDKPWTDPNSIQELYHGEGLTLSDIANRWDCSPATISKRMKRFGIPTR